MIFGSMGKFWARQPKWRRRLGMFALIYGAATLVSEALWLPTIWSIRATGAPATMGEVLEQLPEVEDKDNAALGIMKVHDSYLLELGGAQGQISAVQVDKWLYPGLSDVGRFDSFPCETEMKEIQAVVDLLTETRAQLHEAVSRPNTLFPFHSPAFVNNLRPNSPSRGMGMPAVYASLDTFQDLLWLECLVHIGQGDSQAALDSWISGLRLAGVTRNQLTWIEVSIFASNTIKQLKRLSVLLPSAAFDAEQLRSIENAFVNLDVRERYERAWQNYRAITLNDYRGILGQHGGMLGTAIGEILAPPTYDSDLPGGGMGPILAVFAIFGIAADATFLFEHEKRRQLNALTDTIDGFDLPIAQAMTEGAARGKALQESSWLVFPTIGGGGGRRNYLACGESDLYIAFAKIAIAIERYRRDHGGPPDALEQLVGNYIEALPPDPFECDEFGYAKNDSGYDLYTFYLDCEDNGGTDAAYWDEDDPIPPGDRTFRVIYR